MAIFNPEDTFAGLADILGFLLLLVAVWWIVEAFAVRDVNPLWWIGLISGLLMLAVAFWTSGQFFIEKAYVLLVFAGFWALLHGITDVFKAFAVRSFAIPRPDKRPVNTLTVCRFGSPASAERAIPRLRRLAEDGELAIGDAALVTWRSGARKPSTRPLGTLTGPGELWGGFWGVLLGLIFLAPIAGPAFGAAAGAFAGTLVDFGVDEEFVKKTRDHVTPGTSALFTLSDTAAADVLAARMSGPGMLVLRCTLDADHEQRLLAALGEEDVHH